MQKENLKQRAYLNTVTNAIDFSAKQIVGFVLVPIILSFLGPVLYGAWKILQQLNNYMLTADINVAQPLKLIIAKQRSVEDGVEFRRLFTSACFATLLFLPLYILAGAVLIWLSPYITGIEQHFFPIVRISMAFLVSAFIVRQLFSLPEAVLRGMNLAYKRMGLRAIVTIIGGFLTAISLYLGYGLEGIAFVQLMVVVFSGIIIWRIIVVNVDWYGFERIGILDVKEIIKKSSWFMGEKVVRVFDRSSDFLLLGYFAGPKYVTIYAVSRYLMNSSVNAINQVLPALTPGFAKFLGENNKEKILETRYKVKILLIIVGTILGSLICLWNKSFISVWLDPEYFAGIFVNFLIVITFSIIILQEIDGSLINISLDLRKKITLIIVSIAFTIGLAIILVPTYNIPGLLLSLLAGKLITSLGYIYIFKKQLKVDKSLNTNSYTKILTLNFIVVVISSFLGQYIYAESWFILIFGMLLSIIVLFCLIWFLIIDASNKEWIFNLIKSIKLYDKDNNERDKI